jgi:hypothetical protein
LHALHLKAFESGHKSRPNLIVDSFNIPSTQSVTRQLSAVERIKSVLQFDVNLQYEGADSYLALLFAFLKPSDENPFSFWLYVGPVCGAYVTKWLMPRFHFIKIQYDISGGDDIEDNTAFYKRLVFDTLQGPPFNYLYLIKNCLLIIHNNAILH